MNNNYFELYGLPVSFYPDQATVKNKYYELSRQYHPDKHVQAGDEASEAALRMSAMNNDAYKTLKSQDEVMAYILKLNGVLEDEEKYNLPQEFLIEMMDINEIVSECEANSSDLTVRRRADDAMKEQMEKWAVDTDKLTDRFENGEQAPELLLKIKDQYFRKKYLLRIQERINSFAPHS
jgi:molecular chaperone HscB